MKQKRLLTGLLTLALLGILAACQPTQEVDTAVTSEVAELQTGSAAEQSDFDTVLAEGEVVPLFFADLSFRSGGVATEVLVSEGDMVAEGDVLVRLDDIDLVIARDQAAARVESAKAALESAKAAVTTAESRVSTAELGVTAAEAQLAITRAGPRPEEIEAAEKRIAAAEASIAQATGQQNAALDVRRESAITAAQAQLINAETDRDSVQDSYDNIIDACFTNPATGKEVCPLYGPIEEQTRAQLAVAQANVEAARAQLNQAQAGATPGQRSAAAGGVAVAEAQRDLAERQLELLMAGATTQQIQQAEVAVTQAQTNIEIARAGIVQAEAAVIQAEAAVNTAEAGLEAAELALSRMTLVAPFSGTIARVNVDAGELVGPGAPVMVLADLDGWLVETTDLTELDVAKVSEGATVEISFDAIPGETVDGEVVEIALVSGLSQGDIVYEVTVRLSDTAGLPVRWGMTTFIDIGS